MNRCSHCQREFMTPGGLTRHTNAAHPTLTPPQPSRLYFYAADLEFSINGQVTKAASIEYDSTKDKVPRVAISTGRVELSKLLG